MPEVQLVVFDLAGTTVNDDDSVNRCIRDALAAVGLVVDLSAADAERMPASDALFTSIDGVIIPRIPMGSVFQPLPLVVAALTTKPSDDCSKGIGNHISPTIATQ